LVSILLFQTVRLQPFFYPKLNNVRVGIFSGVVSLAFATSITSFMKLKIPTWIFATLLSTSILLIPVAYHLNARYVRNRTENLVKLAKVEEKRLGENRHSYLDTFYEQYANWNSEILNSKSNTADFNPVWTEISARLLQKKPNDPDNLRIASGIFDLSFGAYMEDPSVYIVEADFSYISNTFIISSHISLTGRIK
jgi:hypothetical protein